MGDLSRIDWSGAKSLDSAGMLARLREWGVPQIVALGRDVSAQFKTPYPKAPPADATDEDRAAHVPAVLEWHTARERWRRDAVCQRVMMGFDLPGLPHGPHPEDTIGGLAGFATSAIERIGVLFGLLTTEQATSAGLRRDLAALQDAKTRGEQAAAAHLASVTVAADAGLAVARDDAAALRVALAAAEADVREARQIARDADTDRCAALSRVEAWRLSATAAGDALATLRAALRIPVASDGALVVTRD